MRPFRLGGLCEARQRTPGAISCYWPCNRTGGHQGDHTWALWDPIAKRWHRGTFTTAEAKASWRRRPSLAEMR